MANVIAKVRGYFGNVLREPGDRFVIDDEIMDDPKRRPKWVNEASASPAPEAVETAEGEATDDKPKKGKGKGKGKPETVSAPSAKPFEDAPAPIHVKNEINDALGSTQPDWIAPGAPVAVTD
ncbi:hypothetical protein SAMN05428953_12656 [Mesorhizobium muleiense]|uniref:Uncharacterized protein n=1 Tax=Mesorhizobium muleiense TaxID=1004279 RepID=A0A1G9H3G4_9HYPH|nr:hypothetical protein [Mesorhizobium muleiense]SDL07439.1 hypothetical protein SAMN05428953_12656 [Mesorhizobium muleiense]